MAKQNEVGVLVKDNFEQHAQHVDKATKSYGSFKTAVASALNKSRLLGFVGALKSTVDALTNASKAEAEYIESMNLLKVAYDDNTASATNLINKLKDMYGLDPAGLTKTLGTYKQMTSAMGMANETSALLSENLLKMQEDVASLYNLDFATVGKKFQSALAGQSRALYSLGVDITKTSLQQELYNMGIERNINELNKASKTALTYIVMEKQLQNSYGDAAKTINSLANQTKIWQEQTAIAARQIKALVIPVLQVIISYANGIIMAFNGVMEAILKFFGVDVEQAASQFGIGSVEVAGGFDDIGNAAAGAGKKIDKLKLGLRGFDKLNVITTPTDSGSSGGGAGGAGGGVDAGIAKYLKEYNLKDAANNATIIRDRIMEWLKMLKPIEESLGRIAGLTWDGLKWLWDNILVPIGKWAKETFLPTLIDTIAAGLDAVYESAKAIQPIVKWIMENVVIPFGRVLGKTIINILNGIKTAFQLISKSPILRFLVGSTGLVIGFTKLLKIAKDVYTWFGGTKLGKAMTMFNSDIISCIKSTKSLKDGWEMFIVKLASDNSALVNVGKLQLNLNGAKLALQGLLEAGVGLATFAGSLQDINENGFNLINTITLITGAILTVKGAIEIATGVATLFGATLTALPIIGIVAALIGVGGLVVALATTKKGVDEDTKALEEYKKKMQEVEEETQKMYSKTQAQIGIAINYQKELSNLVDENGRVKGSYNDVDKALAGLNDTLDLNIERKGDHLYVNGNLIKSQKDLNDTISQTINKLKEEAVVEMAKKKIEPVYERRSYLLGKEKGLIDELKEEAKKYNVQDEQGYQDFIKNNVGKIRELQNLQGELKTNQDQLDVYYNAISEAEKGNFDTSLGLLSQTAQTTQSSIIDTMNSLDLNLASGWKTNVEVILNLNDAAYKAKMNKIRMEQYNLDKYGSTTFRGFGDLSKNSFKADGGFLNEGEIFVAREAGPEMVGTINGKTAVANNDQIVEAISIGVAKAMSGRSTNVNIIADGDTQGLMKFINFKQQQQNRQYGL